MALRQRVRPELCPVGCGNGCPGLVLRSRPLRRQVLNEPEFCFFWDLELCPHTWLPLRIPLFFWTQDPTLRKVAATAAQTLVYRMPQHPVLHRVWKRMRTSKHDPSRTRGYSPWPWKEILLNCHFHPRSRTRSSAPEIGPEDVVEQAIAQRWTLTDLHEEAAGLRQQLTREESGLPDRIKIRVNAAVVRVDERPSRDGVVSELRVEVPPYGFEVDLWTEPPKCSCSRSDAIAIRRASAESADSTSCLRVVPLRGPPRAPGVERRRTCRASFERNVSSHAEGSIAVTASASAQGRFRSGKRSHSSRGSAGAMLSIRFRCWRPSAARRRPSPRPRPRGCWAGTSMLVRARIAHLPTASSIGAR